MKLFLLLCSLLMITVACSSPEEKYEKRRAQAQEDYQEELKEAEEEYKKAQKEEAKDYIEESEGAQVDKDAGKIQVED